MTSTLRKRDLRRCCAEGSYPRLRRGARCKNGARRVARAESYLRKALAKREVLTRKPPFASRGPRYLTKPRVLNLFMKKLTRERVVPIIVARVPCDIPAKLCRLR